MLTRRSLAPLAALVSGAIVAPAALAQDSPKPGAAPDPWRLRVDLVAWYVAPGGKLRLPSSTGGGQEVRMETMDLDNPRLSPLAEVRLAVNDWRFEFSGFTYQASNDASFAESAGQLGDVAFAPGDQLRTRLDFSSFEARAGYRVYATSLAPEENPSNLHFGLDVIAGARLYDTSVNVRQASGPDIPSTHEFFAEPLAGVRGELELYERFSIEVRTDFGYIPGGHSVWSWDIAALGVYRPITNVGILIGYRQLLFDLDAGSGNDEYRFRGGMAGLFTGVELRF